MTNQLFIKKYLFFLLFILASLSLFGQEREKYVADVQHFTVKDGLAHRKVSAVFQDSHDFIWIGTQYGLNRFDGHEWLTFTKEKDGLSHNNIYDITEDDEGWLWIITFNQSSINTISFVHSLTLEIKTFEERFDTEIISLDAILAVIADEERGIHVGLRNKIMEYRQGKWSSTAVDGLNEYRFCKVNKDKNWLLQSLKNKASALIEVKKDGQWKSVKELKTNTSLYYIKDNDENIWIREEGTQLRSSKDRNDFQPFAISNELSIPILPEQSDFTSHLFYNQHQDLFWYTNNKQFFVFSSDNQIIYDFKAEYSHLLDNLISDIFFDKGDNAWIMTSFGVYKIRLTVSHFNNYLSVPLNDYNTSTAKSTRGIHLHQDKLWVNTVTHVDYIVDSKTKTKLEIPKKQAAYEQKHNFRPVLHLNDGEYLTFSEELVRYKNYEPVANYLWKKGLRTRFAWWLHQDSQEKIWIGTHESGLAFLDGDSISTFKEYNDFSTLEDGIIFHLLQWDKTHILVASASGIYILHQQKGIIQHFSSQSPDGQKIPFDIIYHLHKDLKDDSILWVATAGGGLLKLNIDLEKKTVVTEKQFTITDGLSNNVIYAIYEDKQENLWMSSDLGINQYHKPTQRINVYTTTDGLSFNEFNKTSHHQTDDGQLFFGSMNGVTSFYPSEILASDGNQQAALRLTKLEQFIGKSNKIEDRTIDFFSKKSVTLQPNDKFINLKFALLEHRDADQIKYSYQLSGQGDEWIYLNENQLRLSGLPYGRRVLKIQAQGVTNQNQATILEIPIRVLRPFYLRWWFILIVLGVITAIVVYLFKSRTEKLEKRQIELENLVKQRTKKIEEDKAIIEKQAEKLRNLDQMKSKFFANVSHELRTPLTLMLAPIENTLRENQLTNKAYTNLLLAQKSGKRLNRMINEILDLTKLEAGKLEIQTQKTVWYNFLKNILANFESVANQQDIDFSFKYEGNQYLQVMLDQNKVEIILLNLLSNAFKFTPKKGQVKVETTENGAFLKIAVLDTGSGIHSADLPHIFNRFYQSNQDTALQRPQGGTGIGLALTKEFVQLMNGTIEVESELQKGTTFTIQIPKEEAISIVEDEEVQLIQNEQAATQQRLEKYKSKAPTDIVPKSDTTILLVEDNNDLRFFIQSILTTEYNVITAENGKIALEKLPNINCQLIISDIMMPIMDGYELVEKVKNDNRFNHLPIIVLTARTALDDKLKALRIGVDDYLNKPFAEEEILVRIENLLHNAKNRHQVTAISEAMPEPLPTSSNEMAIVQPKAKTIEITPELQEWLAEVETKLLKNIEDNSYTIDRLAFDMAIGKRQLSRRIKELVGVTPREYIKTIRYTKARELLENQTYKTVKSVAYSVGFKDTVNFSKQFREQFGKFPSEYL